MQDAPIQAGIFEKEVAHVFDQIVGHRVSNWGRFLLYSVLALMIITSFGNLIRPNFLDVSVFMIYFW